VKFRLIHLVAAAVLLLFTGESFAAEPTVSDLPVSGRFCVVSATDLGSQRVKLSLRLHLSNSSADSVTLTSLAFHPDRPISSTQKNSVLRAQENIALHSQQIASSLTLASKASANLSKEVVISTSEYQACLHGRPLHFKATLQNEDGSTQTRSLTLQDDPFLLNIA
jgi:hypothetical protein